ncbi:MULTISPECIES: AAA family ATPase [Sphingobacterium]|uniref:AAA family ATPase n=1 Tax=Sphingobacterium TaxID=28453 RepID=UPI001048877E|nr:MULTISPECIES: AAA family ATPase [Sphingobacterium]MCW2260306.1 putative ATPase [Sphingobacterium kitahiroshimense]TCR05382.1 putative ATPase [Sphingobacterium sp. JUb78]
MNTRKNNFYVITGGPGVGKTTLIDALKSKGYSTVAEDARSIIKQQILKRGDALPWKNKDLYALLLLNASVKSYHAISNKNDNIYFFDRGIVDTICYAEMINFKIPTAMLQNAKTHKYNSTVFILPPWSQIYTTDDERKQTWEEALYTFEIMKKTYFNNGYNVIEVPIGAVDLRVDFILKHI